MTLSILFVGIGGFLGAILRYLIVLFANNNPAATIIVNLTGCFLIGLITAIIDVYYPINPTFRLLIITGFLGSFTTFSTFGLEGFNFLKDGYHSTALLYIFIQVGVGILLVYLGELLGKHLPMLT